MKKILLGAALFVAAVSFSGVVNAQTQKKVENAKECCQQKVDKAQKTVKADAKSCDKACTKAVKAGKCKCKAGKCKCKAGVKKGAKACAKAKQCACKK